MSTVLVVDDKEMLRDSVAVTLQRPGFTVVAAENADSALNMIARKHPDVVVSDLKMPGMDGLELLQKIREVDEDLPVILMTAFGTIETAVRAPQDRGVRLHHEAVPGGRACGGGQAGDRARAASA